MRSKHTTDFALSWSMLTEARYLTPIEYYAHNLMPHAAQLTLSLSLFVSSCFSTCPVNVFSRKIEHSFMELKLFLRLSICTHEMLSTEI